MKHQKFLAACIFSFLFFIIQSAQAVFPQTTFDSAQLAWQEGRLEEAQLKYRMVQHSFSTQESWSSEDRAKFKVTYMRLAQLSENRNEREALIVSAYEVHNELLENESELFPQDLISAVQEHQNKPLPPRSQFETQASSGGSTNLSGINLESNRSPYFERKTFGMKNKWWLASLIGIGVGVLAYSLQPKDKEVQASHTNGFQK